MNLKEINLSLDNLCDVINKLPKQFIEESRKNLTSEENKKLDSELLIFNKLTLEEKEEYVNKAKTKI